MLVLAALSGGVDSSVAAAMLLEQGHEVVGVTLKLWGGDSDSGCCSVSDVDDARRVAAQLGIEHLVFNFGEDFERRVVDPYVDGHARGLTPNPCVECNRHLKFDRLLTRAAALGFDAVATGHHARLGTDPRSGATRLARSPDRAKDQSYVLHMLTADQLARIMLPVGAITKEEVRNRATRLGLRTAGKPDSQDVCFISHTGGGRRAFLGARIPLHPGRVVDMDGTELAEVDAVELVTVGQRRGLGVTVEGRPRYALSVDVDRRLVVVGEPADLQEVDVRLRDMVWVDDLARTSAIPSLRQGVDAISGDSPALSGQASAHGAAIAVDAVSVGEDGLTTVHWKEPVRRIAPGQSVVIYDRDLVLGGGIVV